MHDQPTPTEEEHERAPREQAEHEAMQGPGHDDPELPVDDPPEPATDES
jgi:hypothetical protein